MNNLLTRMLCMVLLSSGVIEGMTSETAKALRVESEAEFARARRIEGLLAEETAREAPRLLKLVKAQAVRAAISALERTKVETIRALERIRVEAARDAEWIKVEAACQARSVAARNNLGFGVVLGVAVIGAEIVAIIRERKVAKKRLQELRKKMGLALN